MQVFTWLSTFSLSLKIKYSWGTCTL